MLKRMRINSFENGVPSEGQCKFHQTVKRAQYKFILLTAVRLRNPPKAEHRIIILGFCYVAVRRVFPVARFKQAERANIGTNTRATTHEETLSETAHACI